MIGEFRLHSSDREVSVAVDEEPHPNEAFEVLRPQRPGLDAVYVDEDDGWPAAEVVPVWEFGCEEEAAAAGQQAEDAAVAAWRIEEKDLD